MKKTFEEQIEEQIRIKLEDNIKLRNIDKNAEEKKWIVDISAFCGSLEKIKKKLKNESFSLEDKLEKKINLNFIKSEYTADYTFCIDSKEITDSKECSYSDYRLFFNITE